MLKWLVLQYAIVALGVAIFFVVDSVAEKDFTSLQPKFPAFSFIVPRCLHCPCEPKDSANFNVWVTVLPRVHYFAEHNFSKENLANSIKNV